MTEAISAGAIGAYGGLRLLTAWRCVVHWRASPFSRKALFHCLVAGFSATRLGAAVIDASVGSAWPRVVFELSSLGTWFYFLQFLVIVTKWATATSASNSVRAQRIRLVSKLAGGSVTLTGIVLTVLVVVLPKRADTRAFDKPFEHSAEPAVLYVCDYQYHTFLGLSVDFGGPQLSYSVRRLHLLWLQAPPARAASVPGEC